jgi:hypothetical protein
MKKGKKMTWFEVQEKLRKLKDLMTKAHYSNEYFSLEMFINLEFPSIVLEKNDDGMLERAKEHTLNLKSNLWINETTIKTEPLKYYLVTQKWDAEDTIKNGVQANHAGKILVFQNTKITFPKFRESWGLHLLNSEKEFESTHFISNAVSDYGCAKFEVDAKGINSPIIQDNSSVSINRWWWIINQDGIHPKYLKLDSII